jgi:anti-sigma regulatory factor (Ser/Thr protein kinase)
LSTATLAASFAGVPASVARARRFVAAMLAGDHGDLCDAAALVVSELASNAVSHCAKDFTVAIDDGTDVVRVTVTDEGPGRPVIRRPSPTELHGRGLQIVRELSDAWGVELRPDRRGKAVWFELRDRTP